MRMRLMPAILLCALVLAARQPATALQDSAARVDAVFKAYDRKDSPGCAVGVYRDGRMIHARGYGMAHIEKGVPITPSTVFDLGSTSKQFTAASILLLAQQGKLSLDDDVRRFIPELPRYQKPITIRHLLHHTSGLRDYIGLMTITGLSTSGHTTAKQALDVIVRQKALNFEPGAEFLYSNSGYFLLAQIIERVTGQSNRAFAAAHIFTPLGMKATYVHDDHKMAVPNRATGYANAGTGFRVEMSDWEQTGDGAVNATIEDLLLWDRNFYAPTVGGQALLTELHVQGSLNNANVIPYARGLIVGTMRGLKTVSHGGSWAGYRAELLRFPEQRLSVAALCNLASSNPSAKAREVATVYLEEQMTPVPAPAAPAAPGAPPPPATPAPPAAAEAPSAESLRPYAGTYFSEELNTTFAITAEAGRLAVKRQDGETVRLRALPNDAFGTGGITIRFTPAAAGGYRTFELDLGRVRGVTFVRTGGVGSASPQVPAAAGQAHPPAVFTDSARRAKLASAFPEIDQLVASFMARTRVPGAAWGIVIDGELAHVGVAGYRDLPSKSPVTRDSVFRIASMTKSFTAMAILKLRDEGKISLDDFAERHVPELRGLRYPTSDSPKIRVRDLLSHAAGFPEDNPWGDQQLAATEQEFTRMLQQGIPFSNPPGVAYEYANYGFAILGRIVTNVSGKPYKQYLDEAILRPLGMTSTSLEPGAVRPDRLAHGYRWEDQQWKEEPPLPDGAFGAMGGMLTSIADLSRYVGAFLSAWPPRDGADTGPIHRASLREMQQIWRSRPGTVTRTAAGGAALNSGGYGYGLRISQSCAFDHIVAHSGGLPGFGSLMQWLPEYGVGIVAFGNVTYTGWGGVVSNAFDLLAKTGGLQKRMPQPAPSLVEARDAVSQLIIKWDDKQADQVAAMNLFLDRSKDRRRKEIEDLRAQVGQCTAPASFDSVENWLRGEWTMTCERADLRVSITLAPTIPPRVQHLEVTQVPSGQTRPAPSACRM